MIYTHYEAMQLLELIKEVLINYDIRVPSPENDTLDALLNAIERRLFDLMKRRDKGEPMVTSFYRVPC